MTTNFATRCGLTRLNALALGRLKTPHAVQDFVDAIPPNFEIGGETCLSAAETLNQHRAHCIEGAFVAALALWMQGRPPLLLDFKARAGDCDHVVALFKENGLWGAISKSNHIWLRWRDPIYRSMRELALSYFHEYVRGDTKTLISYSRPFDLRRIAPEHWIGSKDECWDIAEMLDDVRHYPLFPKAQIKQLRPRDKFEVWAGTLLEVPHPKAQKSHRR